MNKIIEIEKQIKKLEAEKTPESLIQKHIKISTFILTCLLSFVSLFYLQHFFQDYNYLFWAIPFSYVTSTFLSIFIVQIGYMYYEANLDHQIIQSKINLEIEKKKAP
jgi:hypothetical protein